MASAPTILRKTGLNRLSAVFIRQVKKPGIYLDGGGLRFQVTRSGGRRWFLRVTIDGKVRDIALGRANFVSVAEAREIAASIRKAIAAGSNPFTALENAREVVRPTEAQDVSKPTVRDAWDAFWELKAPQLASEKNRLLWVNMMTRYVLASIGDRPVADVRPAEIIEMLRPIWSIKEETARKALQRVDAVFKSAITREWRERASPCIGVAQELGRRRLEGRHLASMPYGEIPLFLRQLQLRGGLVSSRLCLEFLILTAVRSGEARGACWSEIDLSERLWTIPRARMKMSVSHAVPLSSGALEILSKLKAAHPNSDLVFPGMKGQRLSDTTLLKRLHDVGLDAKATIHGFRSSFKNWCAESGVRDEVSEAALAHADRNAVRAAYRRTNYLDERRGLMQRWADFCCPRPNRNR